MLACYEKKPFEGRCCIFPLSEILGTHILGVVYNSNNVCSMVKITLKLHKALAHLLTQVCAKHPHGVLMYGVCQTTAQTFCRVVDLAKVSSRLLSCTSCRISHISYYVEPLNAFVAWLKMHIRAQPSAWWGLVSPSRWLAYNIDHDLYCLELSIGTTSYYILLRRVDVQEFRQIAFKHG